MKRNAVSGSSVSPDYKQARGDILSMAASSPLNEESIQEEIEESDTIEPKLKDIHNLLKNIQSAITAMQGNIAILAKDNNKLSSDVAELRKVIAKNNDEVEKLKKDLVNQNKYVASLKLDLGRVKKASKQLKSDIEDLQENLDELEHPHYYTETPTFILGFHVTSQALLKLVSAILVSLRCQIYANYRPFLQ